MTKEKTLTKKEKVLNTLKKGLPFVGMAFTFLLGLACGSCTFKSTSEPQTKRTAIVENVDTGTYTAGMTDIVADILGTTASGNTGYLWNLNNGGSGKRMEASINLGIQLIPISNTAITKPLGQYWYIENGTLSAKLEFTHMIFNNDGMLNFCYDKTLKGSIDERDFGVLDIYIQFYPTSYNDLNNTDYDYTAYTTTYSKDEINRNFSLADLFRKYFNISPTPVDKNGQQVIYIIDTSVYFNVFDLLGSAFTSLGGLLGIAILPSITLGTLLFVPLVVVIILFIVGLFKR